jgi:hypothetical protein
MKSFEEWTQSIAEPKKLTWFDWEDKGYGYTDNNDGFLVTCRICDKRFAISDFLSPDEFDPENGDNFICGGTQWCIP